MSTRVVTISTCDRCGAEEIFEWGDWRDFVNQVGPNLHKTVPHSNKWRSIDGKCLCPACVRDIEFALNDKPVRVSEPAHGNVGHGHVHPRPDGMKARCGGPGICDECSREQAVRSLRGSLPELADAEREGM